MKYRSKQGRRVEAMQFQGDADTVNAFDVWLNGASTDDWGDCHFYVNETDRGEDIYIWPGTYVVRDEHGLSYIEERLFESVFEVQP